MKINHDYDLVLEERKGISMDKEIWVTRLEFLIGWGLILVALALFWALVFAAFPKKAGADVAEIASVPNPRSKPPQKTILGAYPKGDLSAHFSRREFNQHGNPLPVDQIIVDPVLIERLEKLRALIGNRPIHICSGYRSPAYNKHVGGAHHSQHMLGKAADITVAGMTSKQLRPYALAAGFTFTQTYERLPHLHVDVR